MKNQEQQQHIISRNETQYSNSVRKYSRSIPDDLLIDILSKVPSKSIARFCCVSKLWGSILKLKRHDFTELFELFQTRCPRMFFILDIYSKKKHSSYFTKEVFFFSSPEHTNPDENSCAVASRYDSSIPKYVPSDYNTMLCGLFLCRGDPGRNVCAICNHATGEYITLPKVLFKDTKILPKVIPEIRRFFFGYDPISKQFKVLCMTSSNTHHVLTLENGNRKWRTIESKFDFMERYNIPGEICINGVLYFGHKFQGNSSVVCFDVRSEKFSIIKIGEDKVNEGPCTPESTTLINYKGKLEIHGTRGPLKLDFDLLVLEDGSHKWSKHMYEFPHFWNTIVNGYMSQIVGMTGIGKTMYAHELQIVGMTGTGEMVYAPIWVSNPFYVFYYNLERNTFTRVDIQGFEEFSPKNIRVFLDYEENIKLFK